MLAPACRIRRCAHPRRGRAGGPARWGLWRGRRGAFDREAGLRAAAAQTRVFFIDRAVTSGLFRGQQGDFHQHVMGVLRDLEGSMPFGLLARTSKMQPCQSMSEAAKHRHPLISL